MSYKDMIDQNKNGCANPHIGAIIKRRRRAMKLTLEDVTKGICCVSYLSKLEHGTITPKRYVLNEVLNRLNLKEENLRSKPEYMDIILNCLVELYYGNNDYIIKQYNEILEVECIHYTDIIKAIYYLITNKLDEAEKSVSNAMIVRRQLEQNEIYAAIMISALVQIKKEKYNDALDAIKPLEHIYLGSIELEKLKLSIITKAYLVLGKYLQLVNNIINYQELCMKTVDFSGIMKAKKYFCTALALSGDEDGALEYYDSISRSLTKSEVKDYLKEIYIALRKPKEVVVMSYATDIEKIWGYDLLKDKNKCIELLNKIQVTKIKNEKDKLFIQSMMKKYLENEYFYISFLRSDYYPYLLEHGFYEEAKYIHKILFDYLIIESRYKDAVKIDKDFKKIF